MSHYEGYDRVLELAGEYYVLVNGYMTPVQIVEEPGKKLRKFKEGRDAYLNRSWKYEEMAEELFEENKSLEAENKQLKEEIQALREKSTPDTSPEAEKPLELETDSESGSSFIVKLADTKQKGKLQ